MPPSRQVHRQVWRFEHVLKFSGHAFPEISCRFLRARLYQPDIFGLGTSWWLVGLFLFLAEETRTSKSCTRDTGVASH